MNTGDTIAAISTPLGEGGIGIVRLSGPDAFKIGQKIFYPARKPPGSYPKNRYLYYGYLKNEAGETLDEVLVSFMKAPHTFTREDIVEINGHSGAMALRMILKDVYKRQKFDKIIAPKWRNINDLFTYPWLVNC